MAARYPSTLSRHWLRRPQAEEVANLEQGAEPVLQLQLLPEPAEKPLPLLALRLEASPVPPES